MDKIYQKADEVIYRNIENEVFIIPALDEVTAGKEPSLFCLNNPTSIKIWELIDGKKKVSQIIEETSTLFNTDKDKIKDDIANFLSELRNNGLISKKTRKV